MRPHLRSVLRGFIAAIAVLAPLLGLAVVAITQPTFVGTLPSPSPGGPTADPDRLRRHVETAKTLDYRRMAKVVEGAANAVLLFDVLQPHS